MAQSNQDTVLEKLQQIATFSTSRTGLEGYHDYYENVEYPAEQLAQMGADAVDGLIEALNSENDNIRYYAIKILGDIRDERGLAPLESLKETEQVARNREMIAEARQAIKAGHESPDEKLKNLFDVIKNGNPKAKEGVLKSIGSRYQYKPEVVDPLIEFLHTDEGIRANVLSALARHLTSHEKIVSAVLAVLPDEPSDPLWIDILFALRDHPDPRSVPIFIDSLNYPERKHAYYGLRKAGLYGFINEEQAKAISDWMVTELAKDEPIKEMHMGGKSLCAALSEAGHEAGVPGIVAYAKAGYGRESEGAISNLTEIPCEETTEALVSLIDELDLRSRVTIYRYAEDNNIQSMVEPLQERLTHPDVDDKERGWLERVLESLSD